MGKRLLESVKKTVHTANALRQSKRNGGIKSIQRTKQGTQYNYKNGTGYWVDR